MILLYYFYVVFYEWLNIYYHKLNAPEILKVDCVTFIVTSIIYFRLNLFLKQLILLLVSIQLQQFFSFLFYNQHQ